MKRIYFIVTILFLTVYSIYAVDLNAPIEKKITIKSEIERGKSAISDAELSSNTRATDIDSKIKLYNKIIDMNKQKNTDTEPFYLGAYFEAWTSLDIVLGLAQHSKLFNPTDVQYAEQTATLYFKEFRKIQTKLKIDDNTLIAIMHMKKEVLMPLIYRWDKKVNN
jgi:hypothetical protein